MRLFLQYSICLETQKKVKVFLQSLHHIIVKEDKMVAFEYLRIVERDGGLVYVAQPGGRPPTEFVLTALDDKRAVFINPRHDYPQRIVYELSKDGVLTASIGFAKGRLQSFEFKREGE